MTPPGPVEAVTFDFWNTLCVPEPDRYRERRLAEVRRVLAEDGVHPTDEEITRAFAGLMELFNERWAANEQFTYVHAAAVVAERLDPELPPALRDRLAEVFGSPLYQPALTPHVAEVLGILRGGGVRLGIICDVGMTPSPVLRSYLEGHDVLGFFDHWSFSDEVGRYKPHREIFEHALTGLGGVAPDRAAHIGDLRRTDVAVALDIGMLAIRYRGAHDDAGDPGDLGELVEAHHVIADHRELPALLGVG